MNLAAPALDDPKLTDILTPTLRAVGYMDHGVAQVSISLAVQRSRPDEDPGAPVYVMPDDPALEALTKALLALAESALPGANLARNVMLHGDAIHVTAYAVDPATGKKAMSLPVKTFRTNLSTDLQPIRDAILAVATAKDFQGKADTHAIKMADLQAATRPVLETKGGVQ
jgi:hypothetical protein